MSTFLKWRPYLLEGEVQHKAQMNNSPSSITCMNNICNSLTFKNGENQELCPETYECQLHPARLLSPSGRRSRTCDNGVRVLGPWVLWQSQKEEMSPTGTEKFILLLIDEEPVSELFSQGKTPILCRTVWFWKEKALMLGFALQPNFYSGT